MRRRMRFSSMHSRPASGVFHRVARAAVEQAVEAGACAVDEVALFEQQRLDPAHGEVAQGSRARGSAADDDDVPVPLGIF